MSRKLLHLQLTNLLVFVGVTHRTSINNILCQHNYSAEGHCPTQKGLLACYAFHAVGSLHRLR